MSSTDVPPLLVQAAWYGLLLAGQVTLGILTVLLIIKKPHLRHLSALLGVLLISFLAAIIYSLLFYSGTYNKPEIPEDLCVAEAVLKHGADPAVLSSVLLLLAEAIVQVKVRMGKKTWFMSLRFLRLSRVHIPWINMIVWTLATAFAYFTSKDVVAVRAINTFYCSPTNTNINQVQSIEIIVLSVMIAILLIYALFMHVRDWGTICKLLNSRETDSAGYQDARLLVHACGLGVVFIGVLLFSAGTQRKTVVAAVLLSGLPLFTAIVLGARPDIWPDKISFSFHFHKPSIFPNRPDIRVDPFLPTSNHVSPPTVSVRPPSRLDADLPPLPTTKDAPPSTSVDRDALSTPTEQAPPRYSAEERRDPQFSLKGSTSRWDVAESV